MVRANGLSVHVEWLEPAPGSAQAGTSGAPPTMVMIHGMTSDSLASWYFTLARPFTDAGIRVLMYDLRGHGHSERPPSGYQLDDFVDDLAALLVELRVTGPVYLLGNSFGGTIAFSYAIRHPERVAAIAAIESSPPTQAWFTRMARRLGRAASYLPREHALAEITANRGKHAARRANAIRQMLDGTTLLQDLPASPLPAPERLAIIRCPVLCVYGGNSHVAELAPGVQRLLPDVRTVVVPGQKHSILVDQPDTVCRLILSWLRQDCAAELAQPAIPA